MGRKKNKKYKKAILNLILYIILLSILIYSGIKIFKWYKDKTNNNKIAEQIKSTVIVEEENGDEYPVVKGTNNSFYLNHCFDKSNNSAGWIFADYRNKFDNTDKNIVIYGHNIRDGSMFGSMLNILNAKWYENEENTNITLYTENEKCMYKVFSIYKIENEDYYIKTEFKNDNEFEDFIKTLKKRSIKDFNVDVSKDDNILTLSTCANNNKYRVVLHAKKVKYYC
ncbi:MAG TPA: class B sortase [Clostridiaceae bacterium]|jgi:sortase B|nr:class B sortase [Clostridia bacterium]HJJ19032.1 class B sortase [Clostridiaceae bacterium]